jgi:hypothetical protein
MDKLDKCWLVFEAFGVNFPWENITALPEEELDYLHGKAEEAKKRHEGMMAQQKQQQEAQMAAAMQQQRQAGVAGAGNVITPPQEAYSFNQP